MSTFHGRGSTHTKNVVFKIIVLLCTSTIILFFSVHSQQRSPIRIPAPGPRLEKRDTVDGPTYRKIVAKGRRLLCEIENYDTSSSSFPLQSPYLELSDLENFGWEIDRENIGPGQKSYLEILSPAINGIGLSPDPNLFTRLSTTHSLAYTQNGKTYKPTGGYSVNFYSITQNLIIYTDTESPEQTDAHTKYGIPVPGLNKSSDVTYLSLRSLDTSNPPAAPRFMIRFQIITDLTKDLIQTVLEESGKTLGDWPGAEYELAEDIDYGLALLGTPHGAGIAYFLLQHKIQFPRKTITKITVWGDEGRKPGDRDTNMLFYIDTVSQSPPSKRCKCYE